MHLQSVSRCICAPLSRLVGMGPDSEQIKIQCMVLLSLVTFPWQNQEALVG